MNKNKIDETVNLTNEQKLNIIDETAKEFYLKNELHEIEKAKHIIKISKIMRNIKVKERKFGFVNEYDEVITNNDIDYGIRAAKIMDIDDFIYLGWHRIRLIAENTEQHEKISLKEVTKEYGDLRNKNNLITYLIHSKLKKNKIKINKEKVFAEVENGLLLRHLNRTAIQHLKKSGNASISLIYVQFGIYPQDINSVISKKELSKNDIQRLEASYLFFKELFGDDERVVSIPQNVYEKLCEMADSLLAKYVEVKSKFKNEKIDSEDVYKLQQQIKNYGEVA